MALNTTTAVLEIMDLGSSVTGSDIDPFLDLAALIVSEQITPLGTVTVDRATEIEKWLTAHFVSIKYMQSDMERAGAVSQSFQYRVDLNFNQTRYGQQALAIDTTGVLASMQKKAEKGGGGITFEWLGTDPAVTVCEV